MLVFGSAGAVLDRAYHERLPIIIAAPGKENRKSRANSTSMPCLRHTLRYFLRDPVQLRASYHDLDDVGCSLVLAAEVVGEAVRCKAHK